MEPSHHGNDTKPSKRALPPTQPKQAPMTYSPVYVLDPSYASPRQEAIDQEPLQPVMGLQQQQPLQQQQNQSLSKRKTRRAKAKGKSARQDATADSNSNQQEEMTKERTLDGFFMLERCKVEFPDEVTQTSLSGLRIHQVIAEDLLFFTNLARLDMSDNQAPFEPFGNLPALVELDFQCNALESVIVDNGFMNLEVLNLSYNCLTSKDVEEISTLLKIRELYLANNVIASLPPIMDRFSRLEVLSLEHNNLAGEEAFALLAMVPKLRNLNLSHNRMTRFPESALTLLGKRGASFTQLKYLNLAHNAIAHEDDVIHTRELVSLKKLVLYGNPLCKEAVLSYDRTKLAFDPVPNLTASVASMGTNVTLILAYPETKKKKHLLNSYENVEIYKMIPNELLLQSPRYRCKDNDFQATELLPALTMGKDKDKAPRKELKQVDATDSTFLTGVGIEDVFNAQTNSSTPAIPTYVIQRTLAQTTNTNPMKARAAINALRYQLDHPLTSHDDADLLPTHSQKPTQNHLARQRPRRPYQSKEPSTSTALLRNREVSEEVDQVIRDLGTRLSNIETKEEEQVEKAMDALVVAAEKVNAAYTFNPVQ